VPKVQRPLKLFERHWPWFLLVGFVAAFLVVMVAFLSTGALEKVNPFWLSANVRGYNLAGITLGILAVALTTLVLWYSVRKRSSGRGSASMMTWLSMHVWLGSLAIVVAALHGGFGLLSASFTSGKVLFALFCLLGLSGVAWRVVYAMVPPIAGSKVGNFSKLGSERRAQEQETEIEKLSAGKSPDFHRMKAWLLERDRSQNEIMQATATIPAEDRPAWDGVVRAAAARSRALSRIALQAKYSRMLQGWRILHVPMALLFVFFLGIHVLGAFDVPPSITPASVAEVGPMAPFPSSEECGTCHKAIFEDWRESMHAHAVTSPVTVVQNNQDIRISLAGTTSPDPKMICINCHAPTAVLGGAGETLPIQSAVGREGITCVACHAYGGNAEPASGGFASKFQQDLEPGRMYYGPFPDPVGNAYHKSEQNQLFRDPNALCGTCHNVHVDRDNNGKIEQGFDLVLQSTYDEFREYQKQGGGGTCVSCHMPLLGAKRAADGASIPFQQDFDAPPREVHAHAFVGVDYPLDAVQKRDPQKKAREVLLKSAAAISFDAAPSVDALGALRMVVRITNLSGHNLPTGFAFARQLWLEVEVKDGTGRVVFVSGKVAKSSSDLCDGDTFGDPQNPLRADVVGCETVDTQLVNLQTKLMDKVTALRDARGSVVRGVEGLPSAIGGAGAHETFLQHLTGGPVARTRPFDRVSLSALKPNAFKSFSYRVPLPSSGLAGLGAVGKGSVSVRLLFRNLPPYFIRAMGKAQQPVAGEPRIEPLIDNLQIVEMATLQASF
jgi:hypothetical protein